MDKVSCRSAVNHHWRSRTFGKREKPYSSLGKKKYINLPKTPSSCASHHSPDRFFYDRNSRTHYVPRCGRWKWSLHVNLWSDLLLVHEPLKFNYNRAETPALLAWFRSL